MVEHCPGRARLLALSVGEPDMVLPEAPTVEEKAKVQAHGMDWAASWLHSQGRELLFR